MKINEVDSINTNNNLSFKRLIVVGKDEQKLHIPDPSQQNGFREGNFFVSFPAAIVTSLPGSCIEPKKFLETIGSKKNSERLLGARYSSDTPLFYQQSPFYSLTIWQGSANSHALEITKLATRGFDGPEIRAAYQKEMFKIISPSLRRASKYDARIIEDCLATGDTIIGVIAFLRKKRQYKLNFIRIDVVCATTQGLSLLLSFAQTNNLILDIHVGYLAYGLSRGTHVTDTNAYIHANYITYPELITSKLPSSIRSILENCKVENTIYVVGDMGDAGKSLPNQYDGSHPWNALRYDDHGDHTLEKKKNLLKQTDTLPPHVFCANGGYLMQAFYSLIHKRQYGNDYMISAKRVWSTDKQYGYGVLITVE